MGYTHYWTLARPITADEMVALTEDVQRIVALSGVPVAGFDGEGEAEYSAEGIALNGAGEDDAHETFGFSIERTGFDFCKTARKPYDVIVTASLLALKDHLKADVRISSDGDAADWAPGYTLALRALGRFVPSPLQTLDDSE